MHAPIAVLPTPFPRASFEKVRCVRNASVFSNRVKQWQARCDQCGLRRKTRHWMARCNVNMITTANA